MKTEMSAEVKEIRMLLNLYGFELTRDSHFQHYQEKIIKVNPEQFMSFFGKPRKTKYGKSRYTFKLKGEKRNDRLIFADTSKKFRANFTFGNLHLSTSVKSPEIISEFLEFLTEKGLSVSSSL